MTLNPYAPDLGSNDPVAVIAATPARLADLVAVRSRDEIEHQPAPGKWSLGEILAHLADCEIAFSFRLRQTSSGQQLIQPFDQDGWARTYAAYSAEQSVSTFATLRAWNLAFIQNLSEADKALPATHPERGSMTLWTIVETMAGHDLHHLNPLEAKYVR